jgi:hypothetical protein
VGGLTFSGFSINVTGSVDHNLADYKVVTLSDGFEIMGNISAFNGQQGDMLVSYDVSVAPGTPAVNDITLTFNGTATGAHSGATVSEDLFSGGNSIASANVFSIAGGSTKKVDTVSFAPQTSFTVEKDIIVTAGTQSPPSSSLDKDKDKKNEDKDDRTAGTQSPPSSSLDKDKDKKNKDKDDRDMDNNDQGENDQGGKGKGLLATVGQIKHLKGLDVSGGSATISVIDQEFSLVPEPGSLVLLGSGLVGLLAFGRSRNRS